MIAHVHYIQHPMHEEQRMDELPDTVLRCGTVHDPGVVFDLARQDQEVLVEGDDHSSFISAQPYEIQISSPRPSSFRAREDVDSSTTQAIRHRGRDVVIEVEPDRLTHGAWR